VVLPKALDLQRAALTGVPVLKEKTQAKQALGQLETLGRTPQQLITSIETWKATVGEIEMGFKNLNDA
jgi:hypothetical protein